VRPAGEVTGVLPGLDSLRGKVALVTGAARGQGAAEAALLHGLGATVAVTDVRAGEARELAGRLGGDASSHGLDVSDESSWSSVVAELVDRHGRVDVLVNNAGIFEARPVLEWAPADTRRVIEVNLVGSILGIQAVAPSMPSGGSIVNIASTAGLRGYGAALPYSASKFGVRGVSRSAAQALAPQGIRVNCICPGAIETDMYDAQRLDVRRLPIPRAGRPEEVAALVAFLASDASAYCTGSDFVVDGGANA
jgi:3alpha(or 20beta)-hydroxysteroid dehydrogenase